MTLNETVILTERLKELYADKFSITEDGAKLWQANLAYVALPIVLDSVERYYADHPYYPPTLKQLLDTVGEIEREQERIRAASRPSTPEASPTMVLRDAAERLQDADARLWAKGHVAILDRGLGRASNYPATAAFCRQLAAQYPQLAHNWEYEAQWWESGAVGRPRFDGVRQRGPGEERAAPQSREATGTR